MSTPGRLLLFLSAWLLQGSLLWAQQPEQDCISAIPVCQNTYVQNNSYTGHGAVQELNYPTNTTCLSGNEQNSVWYIFTVSGAGNLLLTITPNNVNDDYDWAIYNITGVGCVGILNNTAPNVRCNYSAFPGNTGMQVGAVATSVPPAGLPWCAPLPVLVGETYVLLINNQANTPNGYTLNFSGTAQIFDNIPPTAVSVTETACNPVDTLQLTLSESVKCSSIAPDGSDFYITGPSGAVVSSAYSMNCNPGQFTNTLSIVLSAPIALTGTYLLHFQNGTDGNTLLDNCDNALSTAQTLSFQVVVLHPVIQLQTVHGCQQDEFVVHNQSTGSQFSSQSWDFGPGLFNSAQASDTFWEGNNGNYSIQLTVTDTGGCTATISQAVSVNIIPPVSAFSFLPAVVCAGNPVSFTEQAVNNITTYHWSFGDGGSSPQPNPVHFFTSPGLFQVSLIAGNSIPCFDTSTQTIQVNPAVIAAFLIQPAAACLGDTTHFVDLTSAGPVQWHWDFGNGSTSLQQNPSVLYNSPGNYAVTLIATNGVCLPDTVTQNILVSTYPVVNLGPDTSICYGEQVLLQAQNPGLQYTWSTGDHSESVLIQDAPQWVWVQVNNNGCYGYDTVFVNSTCMLAVPNVFTPNGDGLNDLFQVINKNIRDFHIRIYNRWGQMVYESTDPNQGWNGTFKGQQEEIGTYVYTIELTFGNGHDLVKKGDVTLLR